MATERETRVLRAEGPELRVESRADGTRTLVGYAAVFNKLSEDLGGFRELIQPGAFAKALKTADCRALFNHDSNHLLGRNVSGTLRLSEDETGLRYECDLPDTSLGRDIPVLVARRDISGNSFSFITGADRWDYSGATVTRTLLEIKDLFDVGPVVYPAYPDTSLAVRSLEANRPTVPTEPPPACRREHAEYELRLALARQTRSLPSGKRTR